jgi:hypothetical protein
VWRIRDAVKGRATVEAVPVEVLRFLDGEVLISGPLSEQDRLVSAGVHRLAAGMAGASHRALQRQGRALTASDVGFNLSAWALRNRPLVTYFMVLLGAIGVWSYFQSRPIGRPAVHVPHHGRTHRSGRAPAPTKSTDSSPTSIEAKLQELVRAGLPALLFATR